MGRVYCVMVVMIPVSLIFKASDSGVIAMTNHNTFQGTALWHLLMETILLPSLLRKIDKTMRIAPAMPMMPILFRKTIPGTVLGRMPGKSNSKKKAIIETRPAFCSKVMGVFFNSSRISSDMLNLDRSSFQTYLASSVTITNVMQDMISWKAKNEG